MVRNLPNLEISRKRENRFKKKTESELRNLNFRRSVENLAIRETKISQSDQELPDRTTNICEMKIVDPNQLNSTKTKSEKIQFSKIFV